MVSLRKNLDQWCERGILFFFLGILVFAPLAFGAVDEWAFLIVQGLGIALFLLWLVRLWANPKPRLLWPPLTWVVIAFALYAILRYFTADIEYVARAEVIQVLLYALIFFVVVNNLHNQDTSQTISFTLITLGTLISGYAVAQLVTHSHHVWNAVSPYDGRAGGTYISPNDLAGLLEMLLPLALAYLLIGRIGILTRILLVYAIAAMVAGLGVTFSRGGWLATASGVLLVLGVLLCHRNHRLRALILLLVLLAGGGLFVSEYLSKTTAFTQRVVKVDASAPSVFDTDTRLEMWQAAEQMWRDNFWFGVGPAHYDYRFRAYRPENLQMRPNRAHNDYLNLLADWGTSGGILVLAGIGLFIWSLIKTWPHVRRAEDDFGRSQSNRFAFFLGATGALFALGVHSTMDFNLHIPANALVGATLLAVLASNLRFATAQYWLRITMPGKLALTSIILIIISSFIVVEWRCGHEAWWLAKAKQQEIFSLEKANCLEKAFNFEPQNFQTAYDIGECYRTESFKGGSNFAALAQQALDWYTRGERLNPYDGDSLLRTGMCFDWLEQHGKAEKFYSEAEVLDPNGYFVIGYIGWHYVQIRDYAAARQYLLRSLQLRQNYFAKTYLEICEAKLIEQASGKPQLPFDY